MKQYLLIVDEDGVKAMDVLFGGAIKFIAIEGMNVNGSHQALVTPVEPPLSTAEMVDSKTSPEEAEIV